MNQKVRESLSAVVDGEGDELALRRVLKSLDSSPEEADTWRRYQVIGSIMRRERDIDVTTDISAQVMQRIEAQQPANEFVSQGAYQSARGEAAVAKRGFGRFSFMGNAAVAAAVSLMVITGVQVYRGGHSTTPGGSSVASQSSGMASIADRANMPNYSNVGGSGLSTVGLASEPVTQTYNDNDSSLMSSYSSNTNTSNTEARRQARLLQGFLDLHAQDADFQPQSPYSTINAGFMGTAPKQASVH